MPWESMNSTSYPGGTESYAITIVPTDPTSVR